MSGPRLETAIEASATKTLFSEHGVLSLKLTMFHNSGWPDRVYFCGPPPRVCFVEYKRPGESRNPRQRYIGGLLRAFGFEVQVHDTIDEAVSGVLTFMQAST